MVIHKFENGGVRTCVPLPCNSHKVAQRPEPVEAVDDPKREPPALDHLRSSF